MIADVDRDGKGTIDFSDFLELMTVKIVIQLTSPKETLDNRFYAPLNSSMTTIQEKYH